VASAIGVIVQANRLSDGTRKLTSIHEITGMEGETVTMQEIFTFKQTGVNKEGAVQGYFAATGVRPRFWDRMLTRGIKLSETLFEPVRRPV
jgi:pilus assembly protein CpaF